MIPFLPPVVRKLLLLWGTVICGAVALASAQDRLVFKDNHYQDGRITGMSGNTVLLNVTTSSGSGQMGYNLDLVSRVDAPTPAAFQAGFDAYAAGQWDRALATLKPLVDQFKGLPTDWARQAAAMLGDLYIEKGNLALAEAAYNDFRRLYPGGTTNTLRATLGQARISLGRNDAAQARTLLAPLMQTALKMPAEVSPLDSAVYGEAFYLSGQLHEREGRYQAALEDYLRTVTLFYQDGGATVRAQKSADALRAQHKDIYVP